MNPREYLDLADFLIGRSESASDEARFRTSISRSYYAIYSATIELIEGIGFKLRRDPGGHQKAIHFLANSGVPEAQELGRILDTLRDERNAADYDMSVRGIDRRAAVRAVVQGRRGLELIVAFDRQRLESGIVAYLTKTNQLGIYRKTK